MRFIGKAIEEHKTCEGIAFEEWAFVSRQKLENKINNRK
jgi:hypothetical protein